MQSNSLVVAHLTIISLRTKFELVDKKTKKNVDILLICEIKIVESLSNSKFKIDDFNNFYRVHHKEKGGDIMLLFREDLQVKVLLVEKVNESCYFEVI